MKAVQIKKYGGPEVLEVTENAPKPSVQNGQVLVEVFAAALNPFDGKLRKGYMKDMIPLTFPVTLGGDFAGVITEIGEGVSEYSKGDAVFGSALMVNGGSGAFAQFAAARTKNIAKKPTFVDFETAAALPLVGSSAVQAIEEHIQLQKGQKILIHGGAGGIGHIALQIAKAHEAFVAVTVSSDDVDFVKKLGADEVIDYKTEKFEEHLSDFDAVFDTVGGETTNRSFQVLKKGCILVSMVGQPDEKLAKQYGIVGIGQSTKTNTAHLTRVKELVDAGKITIHIDKVFPIDQAKEAFTYQETVHPKGKVVLKIK